MLGARSGQAVRDWEGEGVWAASFCCALAWVMPQAVAEALDTVPSACTKNGLEWYQRWCQRWHQ